nr:uncharacterized protein LOC117226105 [Megalopta genalis]
MAKVTYTVCIVNIVFFASMIPLYFWKVLKVPLRRRLINLYLAMSSSTVTFFYLSYVCILGACFKKLNKNLIQLNGPLSGRHKELTEKQLSRRQSIMLLMKVKYYEEVHEEISDAVEYLNTMFRTINIVSATVTFAVVTFDLYNTIAQWYVSDNVTTTRDRMSQVFEGLTYVVLRFGKFCIVVWVCETAANYAAEIITTIHDCVSHCADDTIKREQDNAAVRIARIVKNYFETENVKVLNWPAKSPDRSIIENVWGNLSRILHEDGKQYNTVSELKSAILES